MINKLPQGKKVLFFSPHPDDDVISAGALIYGLAKNKNQVVCVYVTNSPRGVAKNIAKEEKIKIRKKEAKLACKVIKARPIFLDLDKPTLQFNKDNIKKVIKLLDQEKPSIIFLPPKNDSHPTHQKTVKIVLEALKAYQVNKLWFYDSWTPLTKPNFVFTFSNNLMKVKIKAIKKHLSQLDRLNYIRAIKGLNLFRGEMAKELLGGFGKKYSSVKQYGEAFLITDFLTLKSH